MFLINLFHNFENERSLVDWEWVAVLQSFKVSSFILAPYPSLVDWDWVGVSLTTIAEKHFSSLEFFLFIENVEM